MTVNESEKCLPVEMMSVESLRPSTQYEHALQEIKNEYQSSIITKVPLTEIATLGGAFSGFVDKLAIPAGEGIYRCVFPMGVRGTLAMARDGSGALGTIMNSNKIVGQARWIPADKAIAPACLKAALVAVAVLTVVKQIQDIKDGQKEIVEILERDKKSQLLVDYDLLVNYIDEFSYYWDNEATIMVNLSQVKNIKRNAMKDIRSYSEQLEDYLNEKKNLLKMQSATSKIGKILNRFIHYKLALQVLSLAEYLDVMLSNNYQAEYLSKTSCNIRKYANDYISMYTKCYDKIEALRTESLTAQTVGMMANMSRGVGNLIHKIPVLKNGSVDEYLIGLGDSMDESERTRLNDTLNFFIQYKGSDIIPIAEQIEMINRLANNPVVMLYDQNELCFHELQETAL